MKKKFNLEYYLINDILIEWNPLGVQGKALADEYTSYIPLLMKVRNDKEILLKELVKLIESVGLEYNLNDLTQKKNLSSLVDKINSIKYP